MPIYTSQRAISEVQRAAVKKVFTVCRSLQKNACEHKKGGVDLVLSAQLSSFFIKLS
jgi:hypothetical protein